MKLQTKRELKATSIGCAAAFMILGTLFIAINYYAKGVKLLAIALCFVTIHFTLKEAWGN
jgi:hypothetical protein